MKQPLATGWLATVWLQFRVKFRLCVFSYCVLLILDAHMLQILHFNFNTYKANCYVQQSDEEEEEEAEEVEEEVPKKNLPKSNPKRRSSSSQRGENEVVVSERELKQSGN